MSFLNEGPPIEKGFVVVIVVGVVFIAGVSKLVYTKRLGVELESFLNYFPGFTILTSELLFYFVVVLPPLFC